jgi:hypothetical protein
MKRSHDNILCSGKECEFPNTCTWNKRCMLQALNDSVKNKKVKKSEKLTAIKKKTS